MRAMRQRMMRRERGVHDPATRNDAPRRHKRVDRLAFASHAHPAVPTATVHSSGTRATWRSHAHAKRKGQAPATRNLALASHKRTDRLVYASHAHRAVSTATTHSSGTCATWRARARACEARWVRLPATHNLAPRSPAMRADRLTHALRAHPAVQPQRPSRQPRSPADPVRRAPQQRVSPPPAAGCARSACARSPSRSPATVRSSGAGPRWNGRRAPGRVRSARAHRRCIR